MPSYAIDLVRKYASQENKQHIPLLYGPPSTRAKYPSLQEIAEKCIGPDEIISEGLAVHRLEKFELKSDPQLVVNGTVQWIATMMSQGWWRWNDYRAGTIERWHPTPKPNARIVFAPPITPEAAEVRSLRSELRQLKAQVTGIPDAMPQVRVAAGSALVKNPYAYAINNTPVGRVDAGQVIETDEATAAKMVRSGILRLVTEDDAAALIAANR